jgi:hypothetical protein
MVPRKRAGDLDGKRRESIDALKDALGEDEEGHEF